MTRPDWVYPLLKLLAALIAAVMFGWAIGYPGTVTTGFLVICLAWQLYNVIGLHRWLQNPDTKPPSSVGLWSLIINRISAMQDQNLRMSSRNRKQIREFERIAKAFPDAILVMDGKGLVRWFNDSASRMLNLNASEVQGKAVTSLIREPAFATWLESPDIARNNPVIDCPTNDATKLQLSAVRFADDQCLLILTDITAMQITERQRRDLVANISHELRTPLTVLLGYLEVLEAQPDEAKPKTIKRMFKQARQMHSMLEELLTLSRLENMNERGISVTVDMPGLLEQLEEQANELSAGEHTIVFEVDQGLKLHGVEADLKSAFQNLLVNAVNYTPENGSIWVSWSEAPEGLVLSVRDNGIGIPHREIPRLTERFYRVGDDRNRNSGGTGLGLAIVKHVLNGHEARLEIISEVSVGSEFKCIFPRERKA